MQSNYHAIECLQLGGKCLNKIANCQISSELGRAGFYHHRRGRIYWLAFG
jgi:hypothetical protein